MLERGDETEHPQPGWMQPVRELMKTLRDVSRHGQRLGRGTLVAIGAAQQLEFNREHQHPLADVVMQLAGDPGSFRFLRSQQTSSQGTVTVVASSQLALIRAQFRFRSLASSPLNQEAGNQYRLRHEKGEAAKEVIAVPIPQRRVSKSDDG